MYKINININQAINRGNYLKALSTVEDSGVPLDTEILNRMVKNWPNLLEYLIREVDSKYEVFEGTSFRSNRFEKYLSINKIPWPRDRDSGRLLLDADTFKSQAEAYPQIEELRQLKKTLSQARELKLEVGVDARNRTGLSPFKSITGRNQPSTTKFIFGLPRWMRSLIKPNKGMAIAYIDWSQQEFGIAAALSGDLNMLTAYASGDPYLAFAIQSKAVPADATKKSHPLERELYKGCVLAVQYQMGPESLAAKLKIIPFKAMQLLTRHRKTYSVFWNWSDRVIDHAKLRGYLETDFGWRLNLSPITKDRTIRNFPMQAGGAEMLRHACIRLNDSGIKVCATIHDAILIEAPESEIEEHVQRAQACMEAASMDVLKTLKLRSDAKIIRYPNRYADDCGNEMWDRVMKILDEIESSQTCA